VDRGLIVVAASGNCVGFVVAPAAYEDAIAVAASNAEDKPWIGSSHGRAIAITAPGEDVWCARAEGGSADSNGTSFATAGTAGAAALWLAYHGRAAIEAARGGMRTQDLFRQLLADSARQPDLLDPANPPDPWDTAEYGPGLLNVAALLRADLGGAAPRVPRARASELEKLAQMVDRDPAELRAALQRVFASPDVEATLAEHAFEALLAGGPRLPRAFRISRDASEGLRAAMVGAQ
jgi:subtilisin family serine protease